MYSGDVSKRNNFGTFSSVSKLSCSSASSSFSVLRWRWSPADPCCFFLAIFILPCVFGFVLLVMIWAKISVCFNWKSNLFADSSLTLVAVNEESFWKCKFSSAFHLWLNMGRFFATVCPSIRKKTTKKTRKSMFFDNALSKRHCTHSLASIFRNNFWSFSFTHRFLILCINIGLVFGGHCGELTVTILLLFSKYNFHPNQRCRRVIFRKQRDEANRSVCVWWCVFQWRCSQFAILSEKTNLSITDVLTKI